MIRNPTPIVLVLAVYLCYAVVVVRGENNPGEIDKLSCAVATQRVQCGDLTCNASSLTCEKCVLAVECGSVKEDCTATGQCVLRSFGSNFDFKAVIAMLLAIAVCAIAVVAGVGGGGILVPVYVVFLGVPMVDAVALSQATIAGQSFINLTMIVGRHHPDHNGPREPTRPVINYEYLTLLLPISLVGTMYGSLLGKMVPDWFRVALLMAMLGGLSFRVVKKAVTQFRADAAKRRQVTHRSSEADDDDDEENESAELAARSRFSSTSVGDDFVPVSATHLQQQQLQEDEGNELADEGFEDGEKPPEMLPQYPPKELALCFFMFCVLLLCNAIRTLAVDCGTFLYAVMFLVPTVVLCGTFYFAWSALHKRWQLIVTGHLLPDEVPFMWSPMTTVVFPLVAIVAGGAAALLGIGGGLVLSTLLFEARLSPEEASATGSVATLLVAGASALQFVLMQQLRLDYGIVFLLSGMASSFIGQFGLVRPIRRRKWNFMILVCLAFVLFGSMISLSALGIYNTTETVHHHGSLGFAPMCK